jgi:subtilase family serine protease
MFCKNRRLLPALALTVAMWTPQFANAQGKGIVLPSLDVQGKAQKKSVGLTPAQIRRAYGFDQIKNQGEGQTIAIVNAFDHPAIEDDLAKFNKQFRLPDLPACPPWRSSVPCFEKVFASGANPGTNDPNYDFWALETALDVEWAHAIAPKATIILVEVASTGEPVGATLDDLLGGVEVALNPAYHASVISMSWGGGEFSTEAQDEDGHFVKSNVTFFASAGDAGHGVIYPAASPYVMSVGGTRLTIDGDGNYQSERAWIGSGGGLSAFEPEPPYQIAYPIPLDPQHLRGTPDVAYDGAPATGVAVYDSVPYLGSSGWLQVGGTSIGPPQWSGLVAIANSLRAADNKPALTGSHGVLYDAAQDRDDDAAFHDITHGKDGNCGLVCKAKPGYDYVTGLGTPKADLLILALHDLP